MGHIQRGVLLLLGLVLLACNPQRQADNWQVELSVSGGFAGVTRHLRLDDQGHLRVTDRRGDVSRESQLDSDAIQSIAEAIQALDQTHKANKTNQLGNRCADCIVYQLLVKRDTRQTNYQMDSVSLSGTPQAELVKQLVDRMNQALAK